MDDSRCAASPALGSLRSAIEIVTSPPGGENSYQVVQSVGFFLEGRIMSNEYTNENGPPNGAQHRLQRCPLGMSRFQRR